MKKYTIEEFVQLMYIHNKKNGIRLKDLWTKNEKALKGYIVYKQSNFKKEYSLESRTYMTYSTWGKIFFDTPSGSVSLKGDNLDGTDTGVRLDYYNWEVEYCYLENEND